MAYVTANAFAPVSVAAWAKGVIAQIKDYYAKRAEFKTTFEELDALTDRELSDIGVARSDIKGIALSHAYGG